MSIEAPPVVDVKLASVLQNCNPAHVRLLFVCQEDKRWEFHLPRAQVVEFCSDLLQAHDQLVSKCGVDGRHLEARLEDE